jgi:formylglycine-generating enzyme required for sulfatase activity
MRNQRLGRRSQGSGSWQWMMIGIFLGMGCSLVMLLSANLFGFVEFTVDEESGSSDGDTVVITNTPAPTEGTEPSPTTEGSTGTEIASVPSFTPDDTNASSTSSSPTPLPGGSDPKFGGSRTTTPETPGGTPAVGTPSDPTTEAVGLPTSDVPTELAIVASTLLPVSEGTFTMGTTQDEALAAVQQCLEQGGVCSEAMVLDSTIPHEVYLDAYQIEQTEVSVGQYVTFLNYLLDTTEVERPHLSFCNSRPCVLTTGDSGGEFSDIEFDGTRYSVRGAGTSLDRSNYPITLVTWNGARAYCQAVGRDLPTEAQWERAARGPSNTTYPWGQAWIPENANTNRSTFDPNAEGLAPVDSYIRGASGFGALNMAGNAAEWTLDFYSDNYYAQSERENPKGPPSGDSRVVRGGSWDAVPFFARTVHRLDQWEPDDASFSVGFRCVDD